MENKSPTSKVLEPEDPAFDRYCRRLKEELGLDDDAVEIIVNLRNQVMILQIRLRTLESTLEIHEVRHNTRLTKYREVFEEGDWEDI